MAAGDMRARVLLVDDNGDVSRALARLLAMFGANVMWIENPREAVRKTQEFQPDLVLLDLCMPDMDGFTVAEALQSVRGTQPFKIFAMTGRADVQTRTRCEQAGFDGFLAKPVEPETFKNLLDSRMPEASASA